MIVCYRQVQGRIAWQRSAEAMGLSTALGVLLLAAVLANADAETTQSLDHGIADGTWTVRNANRSVKAAATVPGGIYSDLRAAGVLVTDILYGNNDEAYRWVAYDNWTYSRSFQVSDEMLAKGNVQLVFEGLDTVAEIVLNGAVVGSSDNMFVQYAFPVKDKLVPGAANRLEVRFTSPVAAALERSRQQALNHTVPPDCQPAEYRGECHANHIRKMQASFAWDWGPAFPSVGLWKSIRLQAFDSAVLQGVTTETLFLDTQSKLNIRAFLSIGRSAAVRGRLEARINLVTEHTASSTVTLQPDSQGQCNATLSLELPMDELERWWPNGMGQQPLYKLSVTFHSEGNETSSKELRVGFRTLELVQEPVDSSNVSKGLSFFVRVNGRPMFAKGSNWIPANILPELGADDKTVRHLLTSSKLANMNMLRVWGGGVYESDLFYQLADEMGILIWQDFMFACSMYPASSWFLETVSAEVKHQVVRLQHHPSVAVWAGNNENEGALRDNWYGTQQNFELYHDDYVELYVNTIRSLVFVFDPTRPYVVSSPSNGLETEKEQYVAKNPGSSLYGDVHYYNYLSDGWSPYTFPRPRFASEFGFQSLPSLETLGAVSEPSHWSISSNFSQSRQHHPAGYEEIYLQIQTHLPFTNQWETVDAFFAYIYFSQINQAMSTKVETETYRRSRSLLEDTGDGLTMGALYWQLNDVWQAPSWASIEVTGRWKMLHYYAINYFAPVIVVPELSPAGELFIYAVSDLPQDVMQTTLRVSVGRWETLGLTHLDVSNFTLKAESSAQVFSSDMTNILHDAGCPGITSCFLIISLRTQENKALSLSPDNFLLPVGLQHAQGIKVPNVMVVSVEGPLRDGEFQLQLETDQVAAFVWLEAFRIAGHFSDNGFLLAEAGRAVQFWPDTEGVTATQLQHAVSVTSVMNHANA